MFLTQGIGIIVGVLIGTAYYTAAIAVIAGDICVF